MSEENVNTDDQQPGDSVDEAMTEPTIENADAEPANELDARLQEAEAKAQDNWDQLLRARAEMENITRRAERDLENAHKYALEKFTAELLPVRDSLELGLSAVAESEDNEHMAKLKEGTELTLKMLATAMEKFGITEVNPLDQAFNPELHQAMSILESPDKAPNTVVSVMQKGYLLNDRLVRPAMVVVSKAAENSSNKVDEEA